MAPSARRAIAEALLWAVGVAALLTLWAAGAGLRREIDAMRADRAEVRREVGLALDELRAAARRVAREAPRP